MTSQFKSHIHSKMMTRMLWRGTALAGVGVLMLVLLGSQMPLAQLKVWGLPLLLVAVALVAFGLVPYRQLNKLRLQPDEMELAKGALHYTRRGQPLLSIS